MEHKKYMLVNETKDEIFESSTIKWVSSDESSANKIHTDIEIGTKLILSDDTSNDIVYQSGEIKTIIDNKKTAYFKIIRFRTDNWDIYRLLCQI